jgi:catechol 2,3-dioxygenase-like lactoylglutathione lyase family enzyme
MKRIILVVGVAIGIISMLVSFSAKSQSPVKTMKMNAGIVTKQLKESKSFYERVLNFGVTFENDFYLLMHTPGHTAEISFLLPNHPTQQPVFQKPFTGQGMYLTIEVADVDAEYKRIKALGIPIKIDLRNEEWGDRHFAIVDPNGVGIDIVTYAPSK